jgi:superfamily II DNA or RNA helicase
MELRPYQNEIITEIYAAWDSGAQNVLAQLATGAGKTVIFSRIIADYSGISIAIAHRVELVSQISLTLARNGIYHNLIAQKAAIRGIVNLHMQELGKSYYSPNARRYVAGVDTLIRLPPDTPWFPQVGLVVQDEGHHPLRTNKWGLAASLFPNARGLYPTATPIRADGKGLGRHADGLMDRLIVGVSMRDLIDMGYLTEYRIFAPPSALDFASIPTTESGDFSPPKLREAVHKAHITGDVVEQYLRIAKGKLGVTFAVDIESATEIAAEYRANGVPAEIISSKTPDLLRSHIMSRFRKREVMQLVNVDLLGEGVDVPAIEVVSMARPTQSYALYSQQFGRALRPLPGKTHAIIIDHVNNVIRHGLPDAPRVWSLDRRDRKSRSAPLDAIPLRVCVNTFCLGVYPRTQSICPHCGHRPTPTIRSSPEQVDGDLFELDPDTIARMRGEIERIDGAPRVPQHLSPIAQLGAAKQHKQRQQAQATLRDAIALWAGCLRDMGKSDSEIYRCFWFKFGIDIASAQVLGVREAGELQARIELHTGDMLRDKRY